jgi:alkylation response protein AidB-like acyl-CoA dehydrogenase
MTRPFTEEHGEIRRYVRSWLDDRAPLTEVRRIMETESGFDPALWSELGELGWLGMAVAEEYGGSGLGFMEVAVVAEEMGRTLFPSPFLATVAMGATLVATSGTETQRQAILPEVVAGALKLGVAVEPAARVAVAAVEAGDGWLLEGPARFVLDGHTADLLVVEATTGDGPRLFLVQDQDGVRRERLSVLDLTRPQAHLDFAGARASLLGDPGDPIDRGRTEMGLWAIGALSMEQVGGARACLEMAVEYARERHQFGRPIGSFQAIKHMCADMLVEVESATSAAHHLAGAIGHDPEETAVAAPLAKAYCADAYYRTAATAIQVFGGIGFTWEHHAHLHLKRAKSGQLLLGSSGHYRRRLAERLGIT